MERFLVSQTEYLEGKKTVDERTDKKMGDGSTYSGTVDDIFRLLAGRGCMVFSFLVDISVSSWNAFYAGYRKSVLPF